MSIKKFDFTKKPLGPNGVVAIGEEDKEKVEVIERGIISTTTIEEEEKVVEPNIIKSLHFDFIDNQWKATVVLNDSNYPFTPRDFNQLRRFLEIKVSEIRHKAGVAYQRALKLKNKIST